MTITTQLVGALGSRGYLFKVSKPATYALPPNPQGWSIVFTKYSPKGYISFKCVNRETGETVWESNTPGGWSISANPTPKLVEATRVGMDIEIRNNTELYICIASGIDNQPPTA